MTFIDCSQRYYRQKIIYKKITFYVSYAMFMLLVIELGLRSFYGVKWGDYRVLAKPRHLLEVYYQKEKIGKALSEDIAFDNGQVDILLLGGSVLIKELGDIKKRLKDQLTGHYACNINIHNLAISAHTSLDSRFKYSLVKGNYYDIVFMYHGINEVRFNNCPGEVFKRDYSHVAFYTSIHTLMKDISKYSIIPHFINELKLAYIERYDRKSLVPQHIPIRKSWLDYGQEIRTDQSLIQNYDVVIQAAGEKHTAVIISTFATYVPADYTLEKFNAKALDYQEHISAIEIWGSKKNVIKGVKTHNEAIVNYWNNHHRPNIYFIDMNDSLAKNGDNFDDICHLTSKGADEFVSIILPVIEQIMAKNELCSPS